MTNRAPLISIPQLPVPDGGAGEWFTGDDGARLRAALYPAKGPVRGSVVLSPGRTEPIEKYHEVIEELQGRGFVVLAHDWRGQGLSARMLSDPLKGHARDASVFRRDYLRLLAAFEERLPRPWIQVGHSMGAGLNLYILAKGEHRFAASALSSPMLGIQLGGVPWPVARGLAGVLTHIGLAGGYVPGAQDPDAVTFEADRIAHDRARWDRFRDLLLAEPALRVGHLTWGWLQFALSLTAWLGRPGVLEAVDTPVLIVASGDDDRVRPEVSSAMAQRLPNGRHVEVPGAWHEILMETDDMRAVWWRAFDALTASISPSV